jgi:hypothetical protein
MHGVIDWPYGVILALESGVISHVHVALPQFRAALGVVFRCALGVDRHERILAAYYRTAAGEQIEPHARR